MLVGDGFRLKWHQVVEAGDGGADGGIDLVLTEQGKKGGKKFLVKCKQWRAYKVGMAVVHELYGLMAAKGATGGFVVSSGQFTNEAISFASGRNVTLIDGPKLHGLLRQAQPSIDRSHAHNPAASAQALACPLCAKSMLRRTAKRGANAGNEFWGCSGYPACRGTRAIN